jgi:uncharacterized protein (TIRG00374 family)
MKKNKLFSILRILISLSLLVLLLWLARGNFSEIRRHLVNVKVPLFILAFFLFLTGLIFMAWRLKVLLSVHQVLFSVRRMFSLTLVGYFFTNFMPTSIGGDIVKGYYISQKNKQKSLAYATVFFDRAVGMFSVALIAAVTLFIMREEIEHTFIFLAVGLLLAGSGLFIWAIMHKQMLKKVTRALGIARLLRFLKLDAILKKAYDVLTVYKKHKKVVAGALFLSILAQFIGFLSIFTLARSLSVYVPLGKVFLVMPVIFIISMLPVTMNGLGLREWGFKFFLTGDIGESAALSLSLLYLAAFLLASLIGGIIYLNLEVKKWTRNS